LRKYPQVASRCCHVSGSRGRVGAKFRHCAE
jgi:hypothetical protein